MKIESLRLEGSFAGSRPIHGRQQAAAQTGAVAAHAEAIPHSRQILRFRKSERMLHWAIAIPFMVCYASSLILMFCFNLHSPGISREVFSWLHRISGGFLILFPALVVLKNLSDYRTHWHNIRHAWSWTLDDLKWLALFGLAAISSRIKLPDQGKFNTAEKMNFIAVMCTYPLFIGTGIFLSLPGQVFLSWIVHVGMALLVTPLMLGHIYMALVNPGTRVGLGGMFSGYVDREWAKHHYHRWYRENFEAEGADDQKHGRIRKELSRPALIRCPRCNADHIVTSWMSLLETVFEFAPFTCPACGADADMVAVIVEPGEADDILLSLQQAGVRYFVVEKSLEEELLLVQSHAEDFVEAVR